MRMLGRTLIAGLALLAISAPVASADVASQDRHGSPSIVPADRVARNSGGRLVGDWFQENLRRPAARSPFGGSVNLCLKIGRRDRVVAPAGGVADDSGKIEMSCTIRAGQPFVLVMTSVDCSSAEPAPFYATTARTQRQCALDNLNGLPVSAIDVSVDGGRAIDIHRPRFLEVSRQRRVVFPQNPVFDAKPGPATFVSAAWMAEIRGLRRGDHTVTGTVSITGQGALAPFVVHVKVVGGHQR